MYLSAFATTTAFVPFGYRSSLVSTDVSILSLPSILSGSVGGVTIIPPPPPPVLLAFTVTFIVFSVVAPAESVTEYDILYSPG